MSLSNVNKYYEPPREELKLIYPVNGLKEDFIYSSKIYNFVSFAQDKQQYSFHYAFLEILNNAIEHSGGDEIIVYVGRADNRIEFSIHDNGVGIFSKIAKALNFESEDYSVLELAKGKFSTNPRQHSGQGIFFSSKLGDIFIIHSGNIAFIANNFLRGTDEEYVFRNVDTPIPGTFVSFCIWFTHEESAAQVFNRYAPADDGFVKTAIPVKLIEKNEKIAILSRSQARRLLLRLDNFKSVELDFMDVESIGQAFADEVFRVFHNEHPDVEITVVNCNEAVSKMIKYASH